LFFFFSLAQEFELFEVFARGGKCWVGHQMGERGVILDPFSAFSVFHFSFRCIKALSGLSFHSINCRIERYKDSSSLWLLRRISKLKKKQHGLSTNDFRRQSFYRREEEPSELHLKIYFARSQKSSIKR
jgi:hypothetical protein